MRACKSYGSPPKELLENHQGLEVLEDYPYDRPLDYGVCLHPAMSTGTAIPGCGYEADQPHCGFYEATEDIILRAVRFTQTEEVLELRSVRGRIGFREYHVTLRKSEEEQIVLHRSLAHDHGDEAKDVARDLFQHELETRSISPTEELDVTVENHSHIRRVLGLVS